jgi:hypothetical protein
MVHNCRKVRETADVADGTDESRQRRKWPYLIAALLLTPIGALSAAKGADNWCDSRLMAASDDGYENKRMSVSVLPPGVRCTGDIDTGPSESMWPIDW